MILRAPLAGESVLWPWRRLSAPRAAKKARTAPFASLGGPFFPECAARVADEWKVNQLVALDVHKSDSKGNKIKILTERRDTCLSI